MEIVGLAVIGIAGLAAFVFAESRAAEPILPLRLFRNARLPLDERDRLRRSASRSSAR